MPRAKCVKCGKRRQIIMNDSCRECLAGVLAQKVRDANAPGATNQVKDDCWAYMNRLYAQVSVHDLYPPRGGPELPPPQRRLDTI